MNDVRSRLPLAFRAVPKTGVIFVTSEAARAGFRAGDPSWANLGQGMPEGGPLPGAPPRIEHIELDARQHEYAPVPGLSELREAIAEMYNHFYRRGRASRYTAENVVISPGGRAGLARAAAAIGQIHLGHFIPDYTAYEELLDIFRLLWPTAIPLDPAQGYALSPDALGHEIVGRGLGAVLVSNPANPTGKLIAGETLAGWVDVCRRLDCTLLVDEFYSHYVWTDDGPMVSAAAYVDDVDRDPVVIFDGLTKNWRYAGWRVAWAVGPRAVMEAIASAASFLDGGAPHPLQRAAVDLVEPSNVEAETAAIQRTFRHKRDRMLERCRAMGLVCDFEPQGSFYVFASLEGLPESIGTGMRFFRAALEREHVLTVPGEFFDVNPGKRRRNLPSRFARHIRLSFGPPLEEVERGLDGLERLIASSR